ncbi:UNVERIFIED_CONTAM: hypothetical protein K2H54_052916 [Gekko kuhli]
MVAVFLPQIHCSAFNCAVQKKKMMLQGRKYETSLFKLRSVKLVDRWGGARGEGGIKRIRNKCILHSMTRSDLKKIITERALSWYDRQTWHCEEISVLEQLVPVDLDA